MTDQSRAAERIRAVYVQVTPREHARECRRGQDPTRGLDRERCERCRNLWRRLEETHERLARKADTEAPGG